MPMDEVKAGLAAMFMKRRGSNDSGNPLESMAEKYRISANEYDTSSIMKEFSDEIAQKVALRQQQQDLKDIGEGKSAGTTTVDNPLETNKVDKFYMDRLETIVGDVSTYTRQMLGVQIKRMENLSKNLSESSAEEKDVLLEQYGKSIEFLREEYARRSNIMSRATTKMGELAEQYLDVRSMYAGFVDNNPIAMALFNIGSSLIKNFMQNRKERKRLIERDNNRQRMAEEIQRTEQTQVLEKKIRDEELQKAEKEYVEKREKESQIRDEEIQTAEKQYVEKQEKESKESQESSQKDTDSPRKSSFSKVNEEKSSREGKEFQRENQRGMFKKLDSLFKDSEKQTKFLKEIAKTQEKLEEVATGISPSDLIRNMLLKQIATCSCMGNLMPRRGRPGRSGKAGPGNKLKDKPNRKPSRFERMKSSVKDKLGRAKAGVGNVASKAGGALRAGGQTVARGAMAGGELLKSGVGNVASKAGGALRAGGQIAARGAMMAGGGLLKAGAAAAPMALPALAVTGAAAGGYKLGSMINEATGASDWLADKALQIFNPEAYEAKQKRMQKVTKDSSMAVGTENTVSKTPPGSSTAVEQNRKQVKLDEVVEKISVNESQKKIENMNSIEMDAEEINIKRAIGSQTVRTQDVTPQSVKRETQGGIKPSPTPLNSARNSDNSVQRLSDRYMTFSQA